MLALLVVLLLVRRESFQSSFSLPDFPRRLKSPDHHPVLLAKLNVSEFCGDCEDLEKKLVTLGTNLTRQIQSGNDINVPDIKAMYAKYSNLCKPCEMLLETWTRYFNNLKALSVFIQFRKLPDPPRVHNPKCSGCADIQKKCKDYSERILSEIQCLTTKSDCPKTRIQTHTYNSVKDCKECIEMYNRWMLYTFVLRDITNWLREKSTNL